MLEEVNQTVPKIHNIKRLHTIIEDKIRSGPILEERDIDFLDSIYIDSRYPSSVGILPSGFPGKEEAEECLRIATKVFKLIQQQLEKIKLSKK